MRAIHLALAAAACATFTGDAQAVALAPRHIQVTDSTHASSGPRDRGARLEVRAVTVAAGERVRLDGVLDEPVWQAAPVAAGFTQAEPREGQPATERTEVRIAFDGDNLYVAARLWDREPDGIVVAELRKDFQNDTQDSFELILDTFGDHRNGYIFMTNAEGARGDQQSANEGRELNTSWDAVWTVKTRRDAEGWTAEIAIPFRALRFDPSAMEWGINFSRRIRRRNEISYWAPVPRAWNLTRVSLAGTLTGLPAATGGRDLRIKPYAAASTIRETGNPGFDGSGDIGLDAKAAVGAGFTLDLSANPDFAQVEVDEQQVNLTQFSQFYPEKREFFLENSGVFYVGDAARSNRVSLTPTPDEDLLLFFSRRIGLTDAGREVPILGGVRLTGQTSGFIVSALTMQTRATETDPAENYTVFRLRRNLLSASDVGAIFMMRQQTADPTGTAPAPAPEYNRVYGLDANIRLPFVTDWNSYVIRTETPGISSGQYAWRSSLNHEGNLFHGKIGVMSVGEGFNDDLGYYRRTGVYKWFNDIGFRPRLESLRRIGVREMHPHFTWNYYTDLDGRLVGKKLHSGYTLFLDNGGYTEFSINPSFQHIDQPLRIHPDAERIPAGDYGWNEWMLRVNSDPSRPLSFAFTGTVGGLWSGTQKTVSTTVTAKPSYRFRAAVGVQRTAASLDAPVGDFVRTIWTARANYSFSTRMFVDAFAQYDPDTDQFNTNVRFNLIHHPLSDLFVVFNEQRIAGPDAPLPGRSVIIKVTQMMAF
jgi:hypothetical protein